VEEEGAREKKIQFDNYDSIHAVDCLGASDKLLRKKSPLINKKKPKEMGGGGGSD